jgi:hypothetical protein
MLGFSVSQATVSRYLPGPSRRPRQSWRTFLGNQASAFGHYYSEERADRYARPPIASYSVDLMESAAAQISTGQQRPTLNAERVNPRSTQRDRGVAHGARRVASVPGSSARALEDRSGAALLIRSPPHQAWVSPWLWARATQGGALVQSRSQISLRPFRDRADTSKSISHPRAFPATFRVFVRADQVLRRETQAD